MTCAKAVFWKPSCVSVAGDEGMSGEGQEKRQVAGPVYELCEELGSESSREPSRNVCRGGRLVG